MDNILNVDCQEIYHTKGYKYRITAGSDEELIQMFLKTGQNSFFEELYQRHSRRVFRQCFSIMKDHDQAGDFTHDIFLKLVSRFHLFKFESRFTTWLYKITANHCFEYLRLVRKRQECLLENGLDVADEVDISAFYESESSDFEDLKVAMEYLSTDEKGLLFMRYNDDLSIGDIADIFKISQSAVKMRLLRLRRKLRLYINNPHFLPDPV